MKVIAKIIVAIDNAIYKVFGIVSPMRRTSWRRRAETIQKALDYQHRKVDCFNKYIVIKHTSGYYVEKGMLEDNVAVINRLNGI